MISLLHPSRGRPHKSRENVLNWVSKASTPVEVIVSIDEGDPFKDDYKVAYFADPVKLIVNDNTSVVEATNHAAKLATGDILLYLSDDFDCPDGWDVKILEAAKSFGAEWLLKVDDCLQRFDVGVLTIPIMSAGLYRKLGYFWHPGYKSMFVDEDLYWTCRKLGVLRNAEHLKFPHLHCSVGKAERDETYIRSEKNWDQGKAFFQQRKAAGFPL